MLNVPGAKYVWISGKIVEWENASIHVSSSAFLYGAGVFEGIRAYKSSNGNELNVFQLDGHVKRLFESGKAHRMYPSFTEKEIVEVCVNLLSDHKFKEDSYLRPLIYPGDHLQLLGGVPPGEICVFTFPFLSRNEKVQNGVKLGVSAWRKIPGDALPPRIKTCGNYVNSRLARSQMKTAGFDDALMLTKGGTISEGTGSNLFIVKNGALVTPDVTSDILEGITRNSIIEFAQNDLGLTVQERKVARSELFACDEAFQCGTVAEIMPVNSVDHINIGDGKPGEITRKLQEYFFKIVRGEISKYRHWLTPVYGKK